MQMSDVDVAVMRPILLSAFRTLLRFERFLSRTGTGFELKPPIKHEWGAAKWKKLRDTRESPDVGESVQ